MHAVPCVELGVLVGLPNHVTRTRTHLSAVAVSQTSPGSPAPTLLPTQASSPSPTPTPSSSPVPARSPSPTSQPTTSPSPVPSPAPTQSPSPAPSGVTTPAPTILPTVPELVEARLAAAVHGIDLIFEPGQGSSGIVRQGTASIRNLAFSVYNLVVFPTFSSSLDLARVHEVLL